MILTGTPASDMFPAMTWRLLNGSNMISASAGGHPAKWALVASLVLLFSVAMMAESAPKDGAIVTTQYIASLTEGAPSAGQIEKDMKSLNADGAWGDINYKDRNRSAWQPLRHVRRIEDMAGAYRKPGHEFVSKPELRLAILKGLAHWLKNDYQGLNWWHNEIGVPMAMANILVLMGDDLPADMKQRALSTVISRAKIGMTGQNKVWLAGIVLVRSLVDGDEKQLTRARDVILSEVRVTEAEGVQPDWSFHQHGPQQQFGNYGAAFGGSITQWGEILSGTSFALDAKQVSIIRNYLLEGPSWILWKGRMDLSGCGRQISKGCQADKGRGSVGQLKRLARIDPGNAAIYQERIKQNEPEGVNTLIGNKHFWRSDMMVHRRPDWYASVKMSSRRVSGSETCNSENMRGLHLGDGVLYVHQTAREYEDIQPFWDWHRLPGTTCDQTLDRLVPDRSQCMLPTRFVGGLSDGRNGVATLDYQRNALVARKSWFFEDDAIICLGAGISATNGGAIITSVQQSLLQGGAVTSSGPASDGKRQLRSGDWVHHAGIGYHIVQADNPILQIATQKGDWKELFTTRASAPVSGNVFSIWLDHGRSPHQQSYSYILYPHTRPEEMPDRIRKSNIEVLSNSPDLQAIAIHDRARIQAVFYKSGALSLSHGQKLTTDAPCLVSLDQSPEGGHLFVADPTQEKKELHLEVAGKKIAVTLPTGGEAGKTVKVGFR